MPAGRHQFRFGLLDNGLGLAVGFRVPESGLFGGNLAGFLASNLCKILHKSPQGFLPFVLEVCSLALALAEFRHTSRCTSGSNRVRGRAWDSVCGMEPIGSKSSRRKRDKAFALWLACHTQEEIAAAVEVAQNTVTGWEKEFIEKLGTDNLINSPDFDPPIYNVELRETAFNMWMGCYSLQEIADAVGYDKGAISKSLDLEQLLKNGDEAESQHLSENPELANNDDRPLFRRRHQGRTFQPQRLGDGRR